MSPARASRRISSAATSTSSMFPSVCPSAEPSGSARVVVREQVADQHPGPEPQPTERQEGDRHPGRKPHDGGDGAGELQLVAELRRPVVGGRQRDDAGQVPALEAHAGSDSAAPRLRAGSARVTVSYGICGTSLETPHGPARRAARSSLRMVGGSDLGASGSDRRAGPAASRLRLWSDERYHRGSAAQLAAWSGAATPGTASRAYARSGRDHAR